MSYFLPFEAEPFEMPGSTATADHCACPKCRAKRRAEEIEPSEASGEFTFEDESMSQEVAAAARARHSVAVRVGSTGEKTCWVQNVLNQAEAENLKTDGIFGPLTRGAVLRFQSRRGLQADGIVGPQTETALVQTALNTIARASLVAVDGVMNARTQQEIRRFQLEQHLVVDGIVGQRTRGAMVTALHGRRCPVRATPPPVRPPTPRPPVPPPAPTPPPQPPPVQPPRPPIQVCPIAGRGNTVQSVHPKFVPVQGIGINGTFTTNASASIVNNPSGPCLLLVDATITTAIASQVGAFGSFVAIVNGSRLKGIPLVRRQPSIAPPTMRVIGEGSLTLPAGEIRSLQVEITTGYRLSGPEGVRIESATDLLTVI